jgi:hypothetical protein|tara:strand:- start:661 stop:879 length:219 start_codon:yes stop_codon:yes gene_type:complete
MDKELNNCYNEIFTKVLELQGEYSDLMIAGNMAAQALRIYRTVLNDEDYNNMMKTIIRTTDEIKPYNREVSH